MGRVSKYNSEGYYDPTAYQAINSVKKEEVRLKNMRSRVGEIWECEFPHRTESVPVLIIADDGNVVTFLRLVDEKNDKHDIEVVCRGKMYASSRMIQYTFDQSIVSFERIVSDKDFKEIMDKIAASLGFESKVLDHCENKDTNPEPVFIPHAEPDIFTEMELERTKAQLEVYKSLYENLMQQMIGRGA